jgi:hypothetical protein
MKLELQKQTNYDGTWYVILIDGVEKVWKRDLKDANETYQEYLTNKVKEIVTLKSTEI